MAETTLCYKKNIQSSGLNNTLSLDGDKCQGKLSIIDMKENGWKLSDSKIIKSENKYNHIYIFSKVNAIESKIANKQKKRIGPKINLTQKELLIYDLSNNSAKIKLGNLKIGKSGIIVHKYGTNDSIITSIATIVETNNNYSTISIINKEILKQGAIPTTRIKPKDGDTFILNHLYNVSLLIVPNQQSKSLITRVHPRQNFINEDFFASHLKLIETPVPSKKVIQDFCISQQIGNIFLAVNNTLYIIDTTSFKVIYQHKLPVKDKKAQVPFYSKIEEIKKGMFDFGDDKIGNYNDYYTSLINNTEYVNNESSLLNSIKKILPW